MAQLMSPVGALNQLFNLDRRVALPLVAGMAVLAAAVIVKSWDVSVGTMGLIGLYVVTLGLLLVVVAAAIDTPWFKQLLGLAIGLLLFAVIFGFAVDVFLRPSWMQPPWCLAKFWQPCPVTEHQILLANNMELTERGNVPKVITAVSAPPVAGSEIPPPAGVSPNATAEHARPPQLKTPKVYIQFAGLITRDSVKALNQALRNGGWAVQGDSGERTDVAAGLNEVRYGNPVNLPAAQQLASAVSSTNITSRTVVARRLDVVGPNLELWISN